MTSRKDLRLQIAEDITIRIGEKVLYAEQIGNLIKHLFGLQRCPRNILAIFFSDEKASARDLGMKLPIPKGFGLYYPNFTYVRVSAVWRALNELADKCKVCLLCGSMEELLAQNLHKDPPTFKIHVKKIRPNGYTGTTRLAGNGAVKRRQTAR